MANHMIGSDIDLGFVDKRRTSSTAASATSMGTPANYASIGTMRTRLTAVDATAYSAANLDKMTVNDMLYALRKSDDNASV